MPADMEWGNIKTKNNTEYWSGLIGKFLKHIINEFTITSQKHERDINFVGEAAYDNTDISISAITIQQTRLEIHKMQKQFYKSNLVFIVYIYNYEITYYFLILLGLWWFPLQVAMDQNTANYLLQDLKYFHLSIHLLGKKYMKA